MGRKTWESIPLSKRPLQNRLNIVLSRNADYNPEYNQESNAPAPLVCPSLGQALSDASENTDVAEIFVIGGQSLYEEALSDELKHLCKLAIVTRINREYESDVFMPAFEDGFEPVFIMYGQLIK